MSEDSEDEMIDYSELEDAIIEESPEHIMRPIEMQEIHFRSNTSIKGLHNIFEEEYHLNSHLMWNEMCIYDFNWTLAYDIYSISSLIHFRLAFPFL